MFQEVLADLKTTFSLFTVNCSIARLYIYIYIIFIILNINKNILCLYLFIFTVALPDGEGQGVPFIGWWIAVLLIHYSIIMCANTKYYDQVVKRIQNSTHHDIVTFRFFKGNFQFWFAKKGPFSRPLRPRRHLGFSIFF